MSDLQKVIVVDSGKRGADGALSAELASMGYASVTVSLDATEEVMPLLDSPAAVVLQIPPQATIAERRRFLALAERLRPRLAPSQVPVILIGDGSGAHASLLQSELGARIPSKPEL